MSTALSLHQQQQRFNWLMTDLRVALPHDRADLAEALCSHADEFGIEATSARLTANPQHFGISPEQAQTILPKLAELHTLSRVIDELVAVREDILCAEDPHRSRHYAFGDREFTVDRVQGTMTFTYSNDTYPIPSDLKAEPARTRHRQRDRDR